MLEIRDFNKEEIAKKAYGGHSGSKIGLIIDGETYLVKFPKKTKDNISCLTSPLKEYLGSHIYELIGIDTHKTLLGYLNGKIVVACKDFLKNTEEIIDFNAIKNSYDKDIEEYLENRSSSSRFNRFDDLEDVIYIMNNNIYFEFVPKLKERFWDMFIIDAFLSNNDRNEANWGLILDKEPGNLRLSPVYDNGASFYNKAGDEKLREILNNNDKFIQMTYDSCVCAFTEKEKLINPLKYIESTKNMDCNKAILRIFPKIDMLKIKELFLSIPNTYEGLEVFSSYQRELYYKMLEYKYEKIFKKVYEQLIVAK